MRTGTLIATMVAGMGFLATATADAATYAVTGSVPQVCNVQSPVLLNTRSPVNVLGLTGQSLTIAQLVDPETLAARATSFAVGFDATCSVAHVVTVESENNGLWRDVVSATSPSSGFGDAVPYTATLHWSDLSDVLRADAEVRQIDDMTMAVNRPSKGQIELDFEIAPGASNSRYFAPLLAGVYRDTIRVTVAPQ